MDHSDSPTAAHAHNQRAWDEMVQSNDRFTRPARDEDFRDPLKTVDGLGWLGGNVHGKQLLCLAGGGGRQSALYATAGAKVTVVDISPAMLQLDREVAVKRELNIRTVETSMDHLSMFGDGEFEIVIHPVSTCYVSDVKKVFREVARVTRSRGIYISQHKQPTSLQTDIAASPRGYEITEPYYRKRPLPPVVGSPHREEGTLEYLHRWEELVGEMCRAGFVVENLVEPQHGDRNAAPGEFKHRSLFVAPYVRIKARRVGFHTERGSALWTPAD